MKKLRFGHKTTLGLFMLTTLTSAIVFGAMTYMLRDVTDMGYQKNVQGMLLVGRWILLLIAGGLLFRLIEKYFRVQYIQRSNLKLKQTYLERVMAQDITQLQKENTPLYRSQMTQDMDRYESKFYLLLLDVISMSAQVVVSLILLAIVNIWIAAAAILMMSIFAIVSLKSGKPIQKSESKKSESLNAYTAYLEESLDGFEVIKSHQLEGKVQARFGELAQKVQDDNYLVDVQTTHADTLNISMQMLVIFLAIVGGLLLASATDTSIGGIVIVISAFSNVMWPMQQLTPNITQMIGIQEVIRQFDKTLTFEPQARPLKVENFASLSFKQANLGYTETILHNVNLEIGPGQKVLIVGASGAGKSTILKTIRQSIKPLSGEVTLNGQDIYAIQAMDYYKLFASVDQVGFIFNGTLRENMTLYQKVDEVRILETLKAVGLDDLSLDYPLVNNGSNLSGGQRARLLSARALCLEASVIICDEIFAALDGEVAHSIEADLMKLERTMINVSHIYFEDSLPLYDVIYRVHQGRVEKVDDPQMLVDMMLDVQVG